MKGIIYAVVAILLVGSAIAFTPLPKGPCQYTMPATEFRQARTFENGVWQMYHGEVVCGPPGSRKRAAPVEQPVVSAPIVEPPVEPVCREVKVCDWVKTRETCFWKNGVKKCIPHFELQCHFVTRCSPREC